MLDKPYCNFISNRESTAVKSGEDFRYVVKLYNEEIDLRGSDVSVEIVVSMKEIPTDRSQCHC